MALNEVLLQQSFDLACPTEREQHLFAEHFYQTLFAAYPQLQPLFAHTAMEDQTRKLMASLVFVLQTLNKPVVLSPIVRKLGQRHTRRRESGTLSNGRRGLAGNLCRPLGKPVDSRTESSVESRVRDSRNIDARGERGAIVRSQWLKWKQATVRNRYTYCAAGGMK